MRPRGKPCPAGISGRFAALAASLCLASMPVVADGIPLASPTGAAGALRDVARLADMLLESRPDYTEYISAIRPLDGNPALTPGRQPLYMALVRPGARDPSRHDSAPYAGPGVRNDIVFDAVWLDGRPSAAWTRLLLDHEYFHARHLAGATSLPLPEPGAPGHGIHFFEAAAWGFNVAQARAGRYPGLREVEFREALNRYGEHYRALRSLYRESDPATWEVLSSSLERPATLITMNGSSR